MVAALAANLSKPAGLVYAPLILAVSFVLYYAGFWGAGDGKLFFCCATYLLPSVSDGLYSAATVLFLSITFCYFAVFGTLLLRRRKVILQLFKDAVKKTLSADTALRLLLSLSVVSAVSLAGFGKVSKLAAFVLLYVLSAALPAAASLVVVLVLLPLQLLYPQPVLDAIMLLPAAALFAFFFALYSSLAKSGTEGGGKVVFAPFLFAAALLLMPLT